MIIRLLSKLLIILKLVLVKIVKKLLTRRRTKDEIIDMDDPTKLYVFRPYKLIHVNYDGQNKGRTVPVARSGHRIACNDDSMFCFGGFNMTQNRVSKLFREFWKFNRHTRLWTLLQNSNVPKESASTAMVLEGNLLMVIILTNKNVPQSCFNVINYLISGFWWNRISIR